MLLEPVVLFTSALTPLAVLELPVVFSRSALTRAPQGFAPHPPLWIVRQRPSRRQHRAGARVARRSVPAETARNVRDRCRRRTPRVAASMSLLRRPHDHHRDLRARLPAQTPPGVRCSSDRDQHLMMPLPPIEQPSDARHSGWLGQHSRRLRRSINRPAMTPPTLSGNARCAPSARHPHPSCGQNNWGRRSNQPRPT